MNVENVFSALADKFGKGRIPCVVIGGIAVNFHKYTRQTTDIDFMIAKKDFDRAKENLKDLGYRLAHDQDSFAQFESDNPDLMDVDFMFVDQETMDVILRDAKEMQIGGNKFLVPSLESLIAL